MESIMLNNNHRIFSYVSATGNDEFTINSIILYDESSFLSHSQSLMLKVFKDGVLVLDKHISDYPIKDEAGTTAEIKEKFKSFKELAIEIYDDNFVLNDELMFNLELEYMAKKPVSIS